jgi:hypothetical protein
VLRHDIKAAVPDAHVVLHLREFIWRRDPGVPLQAHDWALGVGVDTLQ